jgi:glucoamylase
MPRRFVTLLDGYWLEDQGYYKSRVLASGQRSAKELDIAIILAALHGGGSGRSHSVHDPRVHATLARLEALFDASYAINRERPPTQGPAMGRYAGDVYYSGGAYYFSTLAAAEFCFRAAVGTTGAQALMLARGDAYLETVRRHTPPSGDLSEQFDQNTGAQTSARHLAWSYAAYISCIAARRAWLHTAQAPAGSLPHRACRTMVA